jgi:hypothetical protein
VEPTPPEDTVDWEDPRDYKINRILNALSSRGNCTTANVLAVLQHYDPQPWSQADNHVPRSEDSERFFPGIVTGQSGPTLPRRDRSPPGPRASKQFTPTSQYPNISRKKKNDTATTTVRANDPLSSVAMYDQQGRLIGEHARGNFAGRVPSGSIPPERPFFNQDLQRHHAATYQATSISAQSQDAARSADTPSSSVSAIPHTSSHPHPRPVNVEALPANLAENSGENTRQAPSITDMSHE